ncbi:hypothetical protein BSFA1_80090 (plasmid) [Burkholderia sp. SFA1]|nr:hypothetical protein BSFA1_80090 [Burkholderia sp. SFA1]
MLFVPCWLRERNSDLRRGNCGTPAFVLEENREALEGELFARQPARELDKQATGAKKNRLRVFDAVWKL